MTHGDLLGAVTRVLHTLQVDTGLRLRTEWLALDIHPEDWAELMRTIPGYDGAEPLKLYGIVLNKEPMVERGHPVLRSTWQAVL